MSRFGRWRASLNPIRVDVVGDFAGRGLFAIHGEAMLTHYLGNARVDFNYGFQLLHVIHAIETFLAKLRDRGCIFNILWFEKEADVCMPTEIRTDNSRASKYRLARAVLIQHFSCPTSLEEPSAANFSHVFPNLESSCFREYLDNHPLHFFLGSKAHDGFPGGDRHNTPLEMLYLIASAGYCVAFIEGIEFKSSKAYLSMTTPRGSITPLVEREEQFTLPAAPSPPMAKMMKRMAELGIAEKLTAREFVSICALAAVLSSDVQKTSDIGMPRQREAATVLLHLVVLRHCGLPQRSFAKQEPGTIATTNTTFLAEFFDAARDGLTAWFEGSFANKKWDAFDLFDGRLYLNVFTALPGTPVPQQLSQEFAQMAQLLSALSSVDIDTLAADTAGDIDAPSQRPPETMPPVLPFNHPIMDQHLADVRLQSNGVLSESSVSGKIFQELTHWHNARSSVDPKHVPKPKGFFAKKRHQEFMSDTIAYSASLTGASGKNIDPETIVVHIPTANPKTATGPHSTREKQKKKKQVPKSNKERALEHGEARRLAKQAVLSQAVAVGWRERYLEFEKQPSLVKRYLKAEMYSSALSSSHWQIVGAEVLLYLGDVLLQMQSSPQTPKSAGFALLAMIWSKSTDASKLPLTEDVICQLRAIEESLQIAFRHNAALSPPTGRPLAFKPLALKGVSLLPPRTTPREFLLEHCGPYLERSFDSAPDPRVPSFHPDAWQRKVLDAIDADKSVLAVAPTSAGKTFISFYAMKKVLQANDDDILVYVAPTKALVNQIAAEIQARFSKQYGNREGRSVWAIHTRDYRVNNPKGCQILVTVPSILQILLLAPANAKRPMDFSRRIRRIIFDEVHCIGQSDEGVIWEQLLLLAPCPIIALSATIANPDEFKSWLERSQNAKGFELEMIVHSSRYSDLRKFLHDPAPSVSEFTGLAPVERLPFPGLDSELTGSDPTPFLFVHPIASIVDRNRDTLNDASLEPRDCLSLWKCMKRHQNSEYTISPSLNPEIALPEVIRKWDVVQWETALKDQLAEWMVDPKSPFGAVQEELRGHRYSQLANSYSETACSGDGGPAVDNPGKWPLVSTRSIFSLVTDLRASGALPAILFNYDRTKCEAIAALLLHTLTLAESKYRETNPAWIAKTAEFETWKKACQVASAKHMKKKASTRVTGRRGEDDGDDRGKAHSEREAASRDVSKWETFDPNAPLAQFSFADTTKISSEELEERLQTIRTGTVPQPFIEALRRGVGIHHAGMNRQYRQVVEILFRKGYLTVVVATGTLAMGINMPCKTVVFTGDSIYLTAINYRQASGRAGRRGFDVLGNIVFHDMQPHRALEIMSAKLPDLRGQFPTSVTLILRLFILLHGTDNSSFAADAVNSLLTQNRLYLGGPATKMSIAHHLRFSIDYLRRQHLLSPTGEPLNFSGLIGHLYYAESAVFAFHALLQEGYFHEVCTGFSSSMNPTKRRHMALELVLTLSHLFVRIPHATTRSTSLPPLPRPAHEILARHNAQTLSIFRAYVHSYATQHLSSTPDESLPLTHHTITTPSTTAYGYLPCLPPVTIRSPFTALSGFSDADFSTASELCETVRAGVPLEGSVVPGVPLDDDALSNSYLLDFFKHGDAAALTRDNGVRAGEVWFRLKDFSLVLATVVASLEGFLFLPRLPGGRGQEGGVEDEVMDIAGVEGYDSGEEGIDESQQEGVPAATTTRIVGVDKKKMGEGGKKKKKPVADSWEDEVSSSSESESELEKGEVGETPAVLTAERTESAPGWTRDGGAQSLVKVYEAFRMVQCEFDQRFFKMWA
ncbi:DEAD/DEAH box helicase [Chaetomidium leptoderma]|uniref:DEAD/DEAH box helicase n=1 Tax=Chaetomidium leptoderma TaxID=669021 RepID=A0AAN6ZUX7_9PEZI|nr:DEAD/DEAH box helicase [Chaetomidium leptoderma]